ncbi:MAG: Stp1/IreP family PP2C-type Ser/Thr phosphatase [Gemmatimonadales bacterium]
MFKRSRAIKIRVHGRTDQGKTRDHNEDNFLVADLTRKDSTQEPVEREYDLGERGVLLVVADGMGGAAAGELASEMATATIYEQLVERWLGESEATGARFAFRLKEAVEAANQQIHDYAKSHPENRGMGTTSTAVGILGDHIYVTQVGDSRAYLIRGGEAHQLTKDQSLMQRLVEAGELTEEEAAQSERRNIILQALGPDAKIKVDLTHQEIHRGDLLVLCSDGLSGQVKNEEIAQTATQARDLNAACERLIAMANERGGPDNITVLIARLDGDGLRAASVKGEVGHQVYPLIDTEANTDPVPVYRGSNPPVPSKRAQQGRRKLLALLLGVALVGGAVGWQVFLRQPALAEPPAPSAATGVASAAPLESALLDFDRVADSVTRAVRVYADRVKLFGARQIDCPMLAQGLVQVEELWTSYNLEKQGAASLDERRSARDQTLYIAVDSVGRHFDRSGCERP